MTERFTAAIALGANVGEPERTFKRALNLLERDADVQILRRSHWHTTDPVGKGGQPPFTNGAVLVETTLTPRALLDHMRAIEERLGRDRDREERFGPRAIDLDLLFVHGADGPLSVRGEGLILPHPRLEERTFVLRPLAQVAPKERLSRSGRTVEEQLALVEEGGGLVRLDSVEAGRAWCAASAAEGGSLGFVPTMGALHEGHLELVRRASRENDRVCVSIFVNPLQFNDPADLERYPRDFAGDARMLAAAGCSMVFTGTLEQFFPEGADAARRDPGPAAIGMEGEFRPGHFGGVATIVDRLFDVVGPTRAYFGAKDFQQCLVVEELARSRGGTPEIVRCPTVRSADGLALASRNALLEGEAVVDALVLSRALTAARTAWEQGLRDAGVLTGVLREALEHPRIEVEYAEIRDPGAWTPAAPTGPMERAVALVAAKVGGVRLLDNMELSAT